MTTTLSGKTLNTSVFLTCVSALMFSATLSASSDTTVYKTVQPDGSITYSDQPSENAETIRVAPVATVPAVDVKQSATLPTPTTDEESPTSSPYQSLRILKPEPDSAFHSGAGSVDIDLKLIPALRKSDVFQLLIDGREIRTTTSASTQLGNIDRGTHTLTVNVLDQNRKVLETSSTTFTLHRPTIVPLRPTPRSQ